MTNCCVCYTTNKAYLFPTVVSAIQARHHSSRQLADVAVYCIGAESHETDEFAEVCASEGVQFACIHPSLTDNSHVAYSRLFLDAFVPKQYTQLLYVDGDTQVTASLDELISAPVGPGQFMAATDPIAFKYNDISDAPKEIREYLARLGLPSIKQYFNSGVLRMNRQGWAEIGARAYEFRLRAKKEDLHFWDQDGLNAVGVNPEVRLPMSIRFNFAIFLRNCRVESQLTPAIYHFMSNPKPWNGNFPPWSRWATLPYREISEKYPKLTRYQAPFSAWKTARYAVQQRLKQVDEALTWGMTWRRGEVLSHEQQFTLGLNQPVATGGRS